MKIPDGVMVQFINKYAVDKNAIIVNPKLKKNDCWTNDEIKQLLSINNSIIYDNSNIDNNKKHSLINTAYKTDNKDDTNNNNENSTDNNNKNGSNRWRKKINARYVDEINKHLSKPD